MLYIGKEGAYYRFKCRTFVLLQIRTPGFMDSCHHTTLKSGQLACFTSCCETNIIGGLSFVIKGTYQKDFVTFHLRAEGRAGFPRVRKVSKNKDSLGLSKKSRNFYLAQKSGNFFRSVRILKNM